MGYRPATSSEKPAPTTVASVQVSAVPDATDTNVFLVDGVLSYIGADGNVAALDLAGGGGGGGAVTGIVRFTNDSTVVAPGATVQVPLEVHGDPDTSVFTVTDGKIVVVNDGLVIASGSDFGSNGDASIGGASLYFEKNAGPTGGTFQGGYIAAGESGVQPPVGLAVVAAGDLLALWASNFDPDGTDPADFYAGLYLAFIG